MIPLALVGLVGLVAWLTYGARLAERSHRDTAESALRDYAGFAGWEFARHTQDLLAGRIRSSLGRLHEVHLTPADEAPPVSMIAPGAAHCGCGFGQDTRFAFRVDLRSGAIDVAGATTAGTSGALARLRPTFAAAARDGLGRGQARMSDRLNDWVRLIVDTLAGERLVVPYTVLRDTSGAARAVYGLAALPRSITKLFDCAMTTQALLPPSLVGATPNDSVLSLRVATSAGTSVYQRGDRFDRAFSAADTMPAWTGGLVTTVSLRPETAQSLLIGGVPSSRLPTYLLLLGVAIVVTLAALVQLKRSRELASLRSHFVANVSHELRTPLAQISMFSETLMLDRERSPEERRHFLSVIQREARRLTHLVEGVLRFSRGEAGATAIRAERRDLVADVSETIVAFQPLAAAADATVTLVADAAAFAWADSGAVRQIVLNLLDNAIKYGPAGQAVTVRVGVDGADAIVSIEDEGVGIPESDRQRVFEPFARLERAGLPRVSGSGIGLSIVRDLVIAHGGRVWVDAGSSGRGTRVSFSVGVAPKSQPPATSPTGTSPNRAQSPRSGPRAELEGALR